MTLLQVMPADAPDDVLLRTTDFEAIVAALREHAVELRRWGVRGEVPAGDVDAVLAGYEDNVRRLMDVEGLNVVDAVAFAPEDSDEWRERAAKARATFLAEHRHAEDEVRFFAAGAGCFYLHLDDRVYAVLCTAGDLLSVPAGTLHWFDMGNRPDFSAIRFFREPDGWVGDFTGDSIAGSFPRLDDLVAAAG